MLDIHIQWDGPYTLPEARNLNGPTDYGLYQYYGDHMIYGPNTLLYLGEAARQTIGTRLRQHNWEKWTASTPEIYVGRVMSENILDINAWRGEILLAEKIILQSHTPTFNSSNLNKIGHSGDDVRVLNWGKRRLLLPEVSISRWEGRHAVGNSIKANSPLRIQSLQNQGTEGVQSV